jgi:hypothetical protein
MTSMTELRHPDGAMLTVPTPRELPAERDETLRDVVTLQRHLDGYSPEAVALGKPITRLPGSRYRMHAFRVPWNVEANLVWDIAAGSADWWGAARRCFTAEPGCAEPLATGPTPGALRIVQGCGYDPGSAVYRFHTAVNETTKHASALVRWGDSNPYSSFRQYDGERDLQLVRRLVWEADVVHCHVDYLLIGNTDMRPSGRVIRHYHGNLPGRSHVEQQFDDWQDAIQVGARLTHLTESPRMQWLPIAVPVRRYAELSGSVWKRAREFRVAHSPTRRQYKGTDAFLAACETLQARGVRVRPVLIEDLKHGDALTLKARCDAVFDSFWLGIQGSGLEGAAMGLPVIAGDPAVADLYREHVGCVPYSYADTEPELVAVLERLALDRDWRAAEAARVNRYTLDYHDYAAVARRYEGILTAALGRDVSTVAAEAAA